MYLKGYQIKSNKNQILTFKKWDFGSDISHTNKVWNDQLAKLRTLSQEYYPLSIIDLDKEPSNPEIINNKPEFEIWFKREFDKNG